VTGWGDILFLTDLTGVVAGGAGCDVRVYASNGWLRLLQRRLCPWGFDVQ
jgi:hypothetical protein